MKKYILTTSIVLLISSLMAQTNFGITAGIGSNSIAFRNNQTITLSSQFVKPYFAYNAGVFTEYSITRWASATDKVNFSNKKTIFMDSIFTSYYSLEIPLSLKIYFSKKMGFDFAFINNFFLSSISKSATERNRFVSENNKKYYAGTSFGIFYKPINRIEISLMFKTDIKPNFVHYFNEEHYQKNYNYGFLLSLSYQLFSF